MRNERVPGWVGAVLAGAYLLALGWGLHAGSWDFPDSGRYLQAADNLRLHGELYAQVWPAIPPQGQAVQEFTIRPLGYPWVIMVLGSLWPGPALLLIIQNLLSLLNLGVVLRWWGKRAQPNRREWMVALLGCLTFPAQLIYTNAVMSEVMLQTVVMAMVAGALLFIKTREVRYFVGITVGAVAALLLKPVFFPLTGILLLIGVGLAVKLRRGSLMLIAAVPALIAGLYMGWNERRTGYFHFSSIAEINLLHYNAAGVIRQMDGPEAEEKWVAAVLRAANVEPDFANRQRLIQARAGAVLWTHPVVYARQHAQGMVAFFLDPGRFDISEFMQLAPPPGGGLLAQARAGGLWRAVGQLPWELLALLGLVLAANGGRLLLAVRGFRRLGKDGPMGKYGRLVVAGMLVYVALLTGPLGAARFLVPVWPLLFALALVGVRWQRNTTETSGDAASA